MPVLLQIKKLFTLNNTKRLLVYPPLDEKRDL